MPNEPLLASDEYVIGKYDEALKIAVPATVTQEQRAEDVTLTNKRIIIHTEIMKLFKPTVHNYYEIPLSSIKVVDRRVQAFAEKNRRSSYYELRVYLVDGGIATFSFDEFLGKTAKLWASEISRVLGGAVTQVKDAGLFETTNAASALPYAEDVAKAVAGTVDIFKSAFRRSRLETSPVREIFCQNCGAKTTIREGETKYCQFCGSPIVAPPM